jgi:hypothetical protein
MPRKRLAEAENPSRDLAVENRARLTPALGAAGPLQARVRRPLVLLRDRGWMIQGTL